MRAYDECCLPVRIWRRRHQLRIPVDAALGWWNDDDALLGFSEHWDIARSLAGIRMGTWRVGLG